MAKSKKITEKSSKEISVVEGSGNVFADLGLEDSEELLVKSGLSRQIYNRIKELKLTQAKASSILGVSQPDISKIVNCRYTGFSIERLISLLNKLSVDVDITIRHRGKTIKTPGSFRLLEESDTRVS
jgi:predicted XRE-type DNA-binding protein